VKKLKISKECTFFADEMSDRPTYAAIIRKNYCESNPQICARYLVGIKLGIDEVPIALWPNNMETAKRLVAGSRQDKL
jgi:hypothetical protein